ncbi:hypothetical protein [Shewanella algae]|uniref:hypothetical protein n=1 Tax=Shewanella algae TaxID=38313 RepID=UPI001AAD3C2D|nr:hypothetical protein [Shewanella algae]QTE85937.1 hypothetical protein JKK44_18085 [Shewanella algae]
MFKHILKFSFLVFCGGSVAGGLPENIEVTRENAESLSIKLEKIASGSAGTSLYQLEFANKLANCLAGRVQTYLLLGKKEISGSSMDYKVGSEQPSVLLHMPASGYDMAVTVQYCCLEGTSPGCKQSISISSVNGVASQ